MPCTFSQQLIDEVIAFHRHSCPGLAIGIRAAEYGLQEFPNTDPAELICVTETDMCAVDGIQYLTGCSLGKGNLIHQDYGKAAFSFFDRNQKKGVRLLFTPDFPKEITDESAALAELKKNSTAPSEADQKRSVTLRNRMKEWIMSCDLEQIYTRQELDTLPPRRAQVFQSINCENCREKTMESRIRLYGGKSLCISCFNQVEQKM